MSWALKNKAITLLSKETGAVGKDPGGRLRVCLAYPNTYPVGMANLGFQAAYSLFNASDRCVAERVFLPEPSDAPEYERTGTRLFTLETQTPVADFDVIAFSVPFENDYVNIPAILALAGVPVLAADRGGAQPLVMAGGVAISLNPEPVADIVDLFLMGEGEGMVESILDIYEGKAAMGDRDALLGAFDTLPFTYVPSFYECVYEGGRLAAVTPLSGAKPVVRAAKRYGLDACAIPESLVTTPEGGFKDTFLVEVERGCGRGCRFCAAGFLYMPPRWRALGDVKAAVARGIERTGKVGLVGTAVSEYPWIREVIEYGVGLGGEVTLSSLRLDMLTPELLELLKSAGYRTMTIAPEAGTERLRAVVNKGMTDADIIGAATMIAEAGFARIKLYFLIGLPTETDSDAEGIVELVRAIAGAAPRGSITVSINPFIPKPFTPFQWHGFEEQGVVERRYRSIKKGLSGAPRVRVSPVSMGEAHAQAYIARADRRAVDVIIDASTNGLRRAIKKIDPDVLGAALGPRGRDDLLPWDFIDHGVRKEYLWREYRRGLDGALTSPCDTGTCMRCGVCTPEFFGS